MVSRPTLFAVERLPAGFRHADDFLDHSEESTLVERFRSMGFHEVKMRGVAARRRVIQYGWKYSFESFKMTQGPPLPDYLIALRDRAAAFAALDRGQLSEAL